MPPSNQRLSAGRPRRRLLGWALASALLAGVGGLAAPASLAQGVGATLERSVKAAFLYKFLSYTEFPAGTFADATAPLVMGVAGSEDMAAELSRTVAGRSVNNRPIAVKSFKEGEVAAGVQLLFIAGADIAHVARVLRGLQQGPMLLVTESELGLQYGSVINFTIIDERVRFDVSLEAADKNNVKLSSRLLTVANHVQKGAP
jgi:hypothetical protein